MRMPGTYLTALALLAVTGFAGCGASPSEPSAAKSEHSHNDGHAHNHPAVGPHGGQLIELGQEDYHGELVHVEGEQRITIYILDSQAKQVVKVSQPELLLNIVTAGNPRQFKLAAATQPGKTGENVSCFQVEDQELCHALHMADARGRLAVRVDGKQYVGDVVHHDHDAHSPIGHTHEGHEHTGHNHAEEKSPQ
jgi:hypothetical protein